LDVRFTYVPNAKQLEAHNAKEKLILYGGAVGGGKALDLSTPIPTIHGWATMGSLLVGDMIFDEIGNPCRVLACGPVLKGRPCYRVLFDDGSEIVADADHLWYTQTIFNRAEHQKGSVRTTLEIASSLTRLGWTNHSIPIEFGEDRYIVDVIPTESVPVRCIKVDSPNELFLAGESMIPTHNSVFLVMDALWQCLTYDNNRVGLYRWEFSTYMKTISPALLN